MVFKRQLIAISIAVLTLAACRGYSGQATVPNVSVENAKAASFTHLFSFSLKNGAHPVGGLVQLGGAFYGTTQLGGDSNCFGGYSTPGCGVVFKVSPSGEESAIYSFNGGTDGSHSFAPLISVRGNLYG